MAADEGREARKIQVMKDLANFIPSVVGDKQGLRDKQKVTLTESSLILSFWVLSLENWFAQEGDHLRHPGHVAGWIGSAKNASAISKRAVWLNPTGLDG